MNRRFLSAVLIFGAFVVGASAQTEKRIEFAKGKSSATVKGNTGRTGIYYVVRANPGQMLVLDLSPTASIGVKVETSGRFGHQVLLREERGGHYEIGLEEAGDYTIFVGSLSGRPVPFTLTVKIRRMTDI